MIKITLIHIALASLLLNLAAATAASSAPPPSLLYLSAPPAPGSDPDPAACLAAASLLPFPEAAPVSLSDTPEPESNLAAAFPIIDSGQWAALSHASGPAAFAVAAATDADAPLAGEEPGGSKEWRWRRAGGREYATVSVAAVGTAYFEHANGRPTKADWTSRNGFDEEIRDALRLKSRGARDATALAGNVLMGVMIAAPVLDSFATLGLRDDNWDALWQTEMINIEAFTFTSLVSSLTQNLLARERPFVRECRDGDCESGLENRGFPSGHVAFAFTGAGLICNHHKYQSLYKDPAADRAACATGIGLATADGVLRLIADRHYATDIATGTLLGLFSGFILPRLLHYSHPLELPEKKKSAGNPLIKQMMVTPLLTNNSTGLNCEFRF